MSRLTNWSHVYISSSGFGAIPVFMSSANNPFAIRVVASSSSDLDAVPIYITDANTPGAIPVWGFEPGSSPRSSRPRSMADFFDH